jgi:hypothetical protein
VVARKKKGKIAERKGSGWLYRGALLCGREGEGEQTRSQAQVDGRRRRAPRVGVGTARHRRPGVAEREGASIGGASGGRSSQAARRMGGSGAGAVEPQEMAGEGGGAAQREIEEKGAGGGRRGLLCEFPKV